MISEPPCKCVQNFVWLSSRSKCLILTVIPTRRRTKCLSENLESAGGEQVRLLDHHRNRDYDPQSLKRSYLDFGGWVCGVFEYKAQQRSTSSLLTVLRMANTNAIHHKLQHKWSIVEFASGVEFCTNIPPFAISI